MNDFFSYLMWFVVGYVLARLAMSFIAYYLERRIQEMQEAIDKFRKNNIACKVERHGDVFYIYNMDTGDFIAQGHTVEEIKAHVEQTRYRNMRIFVSEGEEDVIDALKRTSTNLESQHA